MMLWRATFPLLLRSMGVVGFFVLGFVVLAVSIEKADQPPSALFSALRFQVLAVFVWLSPLITALAIGLACLRQRSNGALQALACSGIGLMHLTPMVIVLGALVGLAGVAAGEWLIPVFADSDMPGWVWTTSGVVRSADGLFIPKGLIGPGQYVEHVGLGDAYPRLASFESLFSQTSSAAMTEQWARPSRVVACIGFALLGLIFSRLQQPIVWVMAVCGVLTLIEAICWSLGSQNQLLPSVAGTVAAWGWIVPGMGALLYSSTLNQ